MVNLVLCLETFMKKYQDIDVERDTPSLVRDLERLIIQLQEICSLLKDTPVDETNDISRSPPPRYVNNEKPQLFKSTVDIPNPDPNLVQVRASKAEMDRRIAAFLEKKRLEVNHGNCREFCSKALVAQEGSCARVDAIFVKRPDSKGHVKVSKVFNTFGPQTQLLTVSSQLASATEVKPEPDLHSGIEERMKNIADHLHMKFETKRDLAEQIRSLEERILYLESLSPEYFSKSKSSIAEVDERIHYLKQSLKRKAAVMMR